MAHDASHEPDILPHAGEETRDEGIDLVAVTVAMLAEWRTALVTFVVVAAICIGYVYSLKPQYVATATFLPQEGHSQADAFASIFSMHGPGELYIGLLKSRSVEDDMISRLGLLQLFNTNSYETARDQLAGKSSFSEGAGSIVTISVRDGSAQNAARIANGYLDALRELDNRMGGDQSKQTRRFFEMELAQEKDELSAAESLLEATEKRTGLIQPETQTGIGLGAIASTRQQITTLQVELAGLLQTETDNNPQVRALRSQISQLQAEEAQLENGGTNPVGAAPSAEKLPSGNLDYARASREVKYHDTLVSALSSQYETARLSEDFGRSAFQGIDRAIAPEHKAWPPRQPFIAISLVFAFLMGIVAVIVKLVGRRIARDPRHRENIKALRSAFGAR